MACTPIHLEVVFLEGPSYAGKEAYWEEVLAGTHEYVSALAIYDKQGQSAGLRVVVREVLKHLRDHRSVAIDDDQLSLASTRRSYAESIRSKAPQAVSITFHCIALRPEGALNQCSWLYHWNSALHCRAFLESPEDGSAGGGVYPQNVGITRATVSGASDPSPELAVPQKPFLSTLKWYAGALVGQTEPNLADEGAYLDKVDVVGMPLVCRTRHPSTFPALLIEWNSMVDYSVPSSPLLVAGVCEAIRVWFARNPAGHVCALGHHTGSFSGIPGLAVPFGSDAWEAALSAALDILKGLVASQAGMPPVFFCFTAPKPSNTPLLADPFPGALVFLASFYSIKLSDSSTLYIFRDSSQGPSSSSASGAAGLSSAGASSAWQNLGLRSLRGSQAWADPDKVKAVRSSQDPGYRFLRGLRIELPSEPQSQFIEREGQLMLEEDFDGQLSSMFTSASGARTRSRNSPYSYSIPSLQENSLTTGSEVDGHFFGCVASSHEALEALQQSCRAHLLQQGLQQLPRQISRPLPRHSSLAERPPLHQAIDLTKQEEGEAEGAGVYSDAHGDDPLALSLAPSKELFPRMGRVERETLAVASVQRRGEGTANSELMNPAANRGVYRSVAGSGEPPAELHHVESAPQTPLFAEDDLGREHSPPPPGYMSFGLSSLLDDEEVAREDALANAHSNQKVGHAIAAPSLHQKEYVLKREDILNFCADRSVFSRGDAIPSSQFKGLSSCIVGDLSAPHKVQIQGIVLGSKSEEYKSFATLPGLLPASCTCPYHATPCKHIVAVLLHFSRYPGDFGQCSTNPADDLFAFHRKEPRQTAPAPANTPAKPSTNQSLPFVAREDAATHLFSAADDLLAPAPHSARGTTSPPRQASAATGAAVRIKTEPLSPKSKGLPDTVHALSARVKREPPPSPARERRCPGETGFKNEHHPSIHSDPIAAGIEGALHRTTAQQPMAGGEITGSGLHNSATGGAVGGQSRTTTRVLPHMFTAPLKKKRATAKGTVLGAAPTSASAAAGGKRSGDRSVVEYRLSAEELLAVAYRVIGESSILATSQSQSSFSDLPGIQQHSSLRQPSYSSLSKSQSATSSGVPSRQLSNASEGFSRQPSDTLGGLSRQASDASSMGFSRSTSGASGVLSRSASAAELNEQGSAVSLFSRHSTSGSSTAGGRKGHIPVAITPNRMIDEEDDDPFLNEILSASRRTTQSDGSANMENIAVEHHGFPPNDGAVRGRDSNDGAEAHHPKSHSREAEHTAIIKSFAASSSTTTPEKADYVPMPIGSVSKDRGLPSLTSPLGANPVVETTSSVTDKMRQQPPARAKNESESEDDDFLGSLMGRKRPRMG